MSEINKKKQLSVLTFNTLGTPFFAPEITKRYKRMAKLIDENNFDVVCLQEIFTYYHLLLFKKIMKRFSCVCYQKSIFGPRGGLVIFSKYPLSHREYVAYSFPKAARAQFYWKIAKQGMLSCMIEDFSIRLITTHLSSDTEHNLTPENRLYTLIANQLNEAADTINKYTKTGIPLILTGDFNIAKHSTLYQKFVKQAKVYDIFGNIDKPTYSPDRIKYFYFGSKPASIDNIFISSIDALTPVKTDLLFAKKVQFSKNKKGFLSDHIALYCILEINKK